MLTYFSLTLCVSMKFPIKLNTIKSEWSIIYIEVPQVIIKKNIVFFL